MVENKSRRHQAFQNAANRSSLSTKNDKKGGKGEKQSRTKVTEQEWRGHVLAFYQITGKKSITKFLEERKIVQRSVFEKRWKESGLKEMKNQNLPYSDAVTKYDHWFTSWKEMLAQKQRSNGAKALKIFVDPDPNIEIVEKNDTPKNNDGNVDILPPTIDEEEDSDSDSNDSINDSNDEGDGDEPPETTAEKPEEKNKKQRKLSEEHMRALLTELYIKKSKLSIVLKAKGIFRNKNAVYRHWKESGLAKMKEDKVPLGDAMTVYENWLTNQKEIQREVCTKNGSTEKAIPVELEKFMFELIKQLALCGQGIGKKVASKVFEEAMKEWGVKSFSRSTLNRFVDKFGLECRELKNIDPARIAQVTPANRDAFFFRLDQVVALLHDIDPENCPWTSWSQVDGKFIDNVDEMGSDNTQHRDVLLIPKEVTQRLFQSTPEGDKSNRHVSLAVFSKSNGWYKDDEFGIEGAPPPMIIHSKPSGKNKDKGVTSLQKRIGLYETKADDDVLVDQSYLDGISPGNPTGITVRTSTNGSMTKELFLDLVCHYIRHLGSEQGPSGMYTFLLTDSHVSRWHPKALYLLIKNRVIPMFFPSHLSIVVQPQDNGVILFLHKCIEETALTERLYRSNTDVVYVNSVLEKAFILFRDWERKKLMDRGSNSTTRSYRITGMKPCDPFSVGWRDNLELYASFNGLQMESRQGPYYGVRPKDKNVCPKFSEADLSLLDQAVPLLAKDGVDDVSIMDDPKIKCYAVANEIISNWIEKTYDERTIRPRPITPVEKLALKHMDITHIVSAEPVTDDSALLLDRQFKQKKREAILGQTKANECVQVRPKSSKDDDNPSWFTAIKMLRPEHMWHIFDGVESKHISSVELDKEWEINLAFDMFPNDKRMKESRWRSGRRRREEKDHILQTMARTIAEEEREGELKQAFDEFMKRSTDDQSFTDFKESIVKQIEKPSKHAVTVNFGAEEHTINVCAHGDNSSSMSRLVMDNICKTLVCVSARSERKAGTSGRRRGGKVVSVKRGSDGFQKMFQIDEQHQQDLLHQAKDVERTEKAKLDICKRRLRELRRICLMARYQSIWNSEKLLICDSKYLTKPRLLSFLKIYNIEGRTKLYKEPRQQIEAKLRDIGISQYSFEKLEEDLLEELRDLGGTDDFQVNESFGSASDFDIDSEGFTSDGDDGDDDAAAAAVNILLGSETSAGGNTSSSESSDGTGKIVSFNDRPTVHTIPAQSTAESILPQQPSRPLTRPSSRRRTPSATCQQKMLSIPTIRKSSRRRTKPKKFSLD